MARGRSTMVAFLVCFLVAGVVSAETMGKKTLEGFGDQKNYYTPDPHVPNPSRPRHSHHTPSCTPTPSHGGSETPTPSHGGSGTPTPSHGGGSGTPTPSHGGGGYYSPPTTPSIVSPPFTPIVTPVTPTPSHGGGSGTPTPSHGGGGYYSPPTTPSIVSPPSAPIVTPVTPTPTTPIITPVTPTPATPGISTPASPLIPVDPNSPTFPAPCNYWQTHPGMIFAIFGYWGTIGEFFGAACISSFGHNLSLMDALRNPRTDGLGALYREGTASFLNSMVTHKFPFTTQQVKDAFAAAATSNGAAGAQAELFKKANEGRLRKHN